MTGALDFHMLTLSRPETLMIGNDRSFLPNLALPRFDLETLVASQTNNKTSSQMSPLENSQGSGSGSSVPGGFQLGLDSHHSESPGPHGSPAGLQGLSSAQKAGAMAGDERLIHLGEDVDIPGAEDWGMEIDENGNIVEQAGPAIFEDELELPPLPRIEDEQAPGEIEQPDKQFHMDDQGDIIMAGEEPLPEAEAFPERQGVHAAFQPDEAPAQKASARRRKRRVFHVDDETQLSRETLRNWQTDYLQNCGAQKTRPVTVAQAKDNAIHLTFGLGIGNIGQSLGIPGMIHPLALQFSGDTLYTTLTGLEVPGKPRGRRRSASEAIEDNEETGRRVKPRLDGEGQDGQGQGLGSDDPFELGLLGDSPPELGREAQDPMSEHLSSAMQFPWNRGSSAVPSSVRVPGSARQGHQLPSSPLKNRGDTQDIVRYSDDMPMGLGDDAFGLGGGIPSQDDSFDGLPIPEGQASKTNTQQQNERLRTALDIEGQNFLSFIETAAQEHGEYREDDDVERQRKWVAFDDMFLPRETMRATAAQAFYHALCLATKDRMYVQQDGAVGVLRGGIWLGVNVPPTA